MNKFVSSYAVIVIGAGHAGLEAAFACAKMGLKTALFNLNVASIANLPCNPSVGGPAKGVVTREIDVLGGMQAQAVDATKIQIKKLNYSKGPGVWCYRAQIDKNDYHTWFLKAITNQTNLDLILEEVIDIHTENNQLQAIKTKQATYFCQAAIITTGTYLKASLHRDQKFAETGPDNHPASNFLSSFLTKQKFELLRLKTGTPPRVYANSLNYDLMQIDQGTDPNLTFSLIHPQILALDQQLPCYLTSTTMATNELIEQNLNQSGLYNGTIKAVGPRYCPSIEDKVVRFPQRVSHQVFVEPIARNCDCVYVSGLSTSFSETLQTKILRTIIGFEKAVIKTYAYAIEYDAINPIELLHTLESKKIANLYFAGQINGTSGYEEAACQGLMAGINAALKIKKLAPLILKRHEAYIGVLIDDLVTKGVKDPYRLLTSRAEHRLHLRNDNVDERLIHYGHQLGLISETIFWQFQANQTAIATNIATLKTHYAASYNLVSGDVGPLTLLDWLKRPTSSYETIQMILKDQLIDLNSESINKLLIKIKYEGYIRKQDLKLRNIAKWQLLSLALIDDYKKVANLSAEAIEKLNVAKPLTIQNALMISGISINDALWIKVYLEKQQLCAKLNIPSATTLN